MVLHTEITNNRILYPGCDTRMVDGTKQLLVLRCATEQFLNYLPMILHATNSYIIERDNKDQISVWSFKEK